jgi:hypothetical protein
MFALALSDCFAPLFQKRPPAAQAKKRPFSFGATYSKEKALKEF